ncbi:MAG: hypothetical protein WC055_01925 [Melioribacteraceae bacterium]
MAHIEFKKVTEIKLNRLTLPLDGQTVWYQIKDENENWRKGEFISGDDLFIDEKGRITIAFDVYHWCSSEDAVSVE